MRRIVLALPVLTLLAACDPAPKGTDISRLDTEVSRAIGDPNTCVLLVEKETARIVYRFGTHANCARPLPACDAPGTLNADALAKLAAKGDERAISCDNGEDRVAWAAGAAPKSEGAKHGDLAYAALMVGPSVLPGREIKIRLEAALVRGGM